MLYVYNGTFEGFLSAVSELLRNGTAIEDSVCKETDILPLLPSLQIETEEGITVKFGEYLKKHFGPNMPETVYRAFLSDFPGIEGSIINYIQLARKLHRDPIDMLHVECVRHTHEAYRRTTGESHSYKGLLRFRSLSLDPAFPNYITRKYDENAVLAVL
jgi:probable DNA metabolism protein